MMDPIHTLEIAVTLFLQGLGNWLVTPMRLISFLGQEEFYLLLMPALYWSVSSSLGIRVGMMLLVAQFTNTIFKLLGQGARPYWFDTRVKALSTETSFGMPSGHSQSSAGIFGLLAVKLQRRWVTVAALVGIFLVGLSRIYLGVHFLTDVLAGWLIGGLLVWVFARLDAPVSAWVTRLRLGQQVSLAAVSSLAIILLTFLALAISPSFLLPQTWLANATAAAPDVTIDPLNIQGIFTIGGTWFGFLAGASWLRKRRGEFDAAGAPAHRLLRYLVGSVGVFILWYGLGAILPRNDDGISYVLRYARYTLIGVWISALAPLLFVRLGISRWTAKVEN
jgi:membrane-associated phospholipid phosphatase